MINMIPVFPALGNSYEFLLSTSDGITFSTRSGITIDYSTSYQAIVLPVPYSINNYHSFRLDLDQIFIDNPFVDYVMCFDRVANSPTTHSTQSYYAYVNASFLEHDNFVFRDVFAFFKYFGITETIVPVAPIVPPSPMITSLNGSNCEHKDGTVLNVLGRLGSYSVDWSTMGMVADSSFTPIYKVSNVDGHNLICPEALLSLPLVP